MSVRAKFYCNSITSQLGTRSTKGADGVTRHETCETKTIVLNPTYDPNPDSENGKFWASSPGGEIKLNCVNPEASAQFKLGQAYYIDFTPVA